MQIRAWIQRGLPVVAATLLSAAASASSLSFVAADLADTTPGEDLWQYGYTFNGALQEFGSIVLLYDPAVYANLAVDGLSADFAPPLVPPPFPGEATPVTLSSLVAQPASYTTSFTVGFVRLAALPSSHPYQVLDDSFNVLENGSAVAAAVPESGTAALLLAGGLLVAARSRRR